MLLPLMVEQASTFSARPAAPMVHALMLLMAATALSQWAHLFEQLPELVKGCVEPQHVADSHDDFVLGRHTLQLLQAACSTLQYATIAQ